MCIFNLDHSGVCKGNMMLSHKSCNSHLYLFQDFMNSLHKEFKILKCSLLGFQLSD